MKISEGKAIVKDCINRGWVPDGNRIYTPAEAAALKIVHGKKKRLPKAKRTGWIDDELNIRNKAKHTDTFDMLVRIELGVDVWPEFYFTLEKGYRFDKAIPVDACGLVLKIAIEIQGGVWAKGNSGHSSGTGIMRDMDKATKANLDGWTLIQVTPSDINKEPGKVIDLIKKAISNLKQYDN
jgi:very-short-patch-repair endonuclease